MSNSVSILVVREPIWLKGKPSAYHTLETDGSGGGGRTSTVKAGDSYIPQILAEDATSPPAAALPLE